MSTRHLYLALAVAANLGICLATQASAQDTIKIGELNSYLSLIHI